MNIRIPRLPYPEDRLFGFLFFIVLIIPLAFDVYNYESFEIIKYGLLLLLIGAALIAWSRQTKSQSFPIFVNKPFIISLGLFWLWALLSAIFAWDKNFSFLGFYGRFTNGFLFYSLWSIFLALLAVMDREKIKIFLRLLVFCGGLVAVWGLMQDLGFGFYGGPTTVFILRTAPSFLGNPDFSGMFLAAVLPLATGFLFTAKTFKSKIYYSLSVLSQLAALVIFASRGGLVGAVAGLVAAFVLALLFKKRGLKFAGVLFLILLTGFLFNQEFLNIVRPDTVQTTVSFKDVNIQNRLGVWELSAQSIIKRPFFGVGLGNFQLMFEHDRTSQVISGGFFDDAHNLPLQLAVTGGLPLLIFFFLIIGAAAANALKGLYFSYDPEMIGVLAAIGAWLVSSSFNPVVIPCYILLAVLISACMTQRFDLKTNNFLLSKAFKKIILFLGGILIVYGCLFIAAEHFFFAGIQAYNANRFSQAYTFTKTSIALNPVNRLYYLYAAGAAIRSGQSMDTITPLANKVGSINSRLGLSYTEVANLNYLLLYQTQNPIYKDVIISNIQKAITLDPYLSNNYFLLAQYDLVFRNIGGAVENMKKGLALAPTDMNSWLLLAKIYQVENNRPLLVEALKNAQASQADNQEPTRLLRYVENNASLENLPLNMQLGVGSLN